VEDLLLLGIDTSGKTASAALYDTESRIVLAQNTLYTQKTHSQVIMPICKEIIAQTGHQMSDINAIAAANGPGSYTGLRIGVAAVKAMSFALGCKCCGVSTLEGLAYNNLQFCGVICSVMKARGELVYSCCYRSNGRFLRQLCPEQLIERSAVAEFLKTLDEEKILVCGDAAEDFSADYGNDSYIAAPPGARIQNATGICLAAAEKELIEPDFLEVSYLQKVKAEKDLEERTKKS
jgi:tRNA threonylcarbamoyladenosine biosynthesis protein TsaB